MKRWPNSWDALAICCYALALLALRLNHVPWWDGTLVVVLVLVGACYSRQAAQG